MAWSSRRVPVALLCAVLFASGAMTLVLTRDLTFFQDSWQFLMNRRELSADSLLQPHNEHIVLAPVAIEILFLNLFGMDSARPEYVLLVAMQLAAAALLFAYARRRVGDWPALMAATLMLFLGPAWQDLLWPFQIGFVGSVLFGIAMLLALDRRDRAGDVAATAFLTVASCFSSLGIPFMAAAAVDVLQSRRERGLARAYVFAIPALLFAVWYLGWGRNAESRVTLRNFAEAPRYVVEGLAASVESVLGLSAAPIGGSAEVTWGQPLLIALVLLLAYRLVRRPGLPAGVWPIAAAMTTSWFLTALNYMAGREPTSSRYMYAGGVFALLLAVELLRDVRFGRRGLLIAGAVTLAAAVSNLHFFHDGARWLEDQSTLTRSDLAALEISSRSVDPAFRLTPEVAGTASLVDVTAGEYLEAEDEFGSPAYTPEELLGAPEAGRRQADVVLAAALPIATLVRPFPDGGEARRRGCVVLGGRSPRSGEPLTAGLTTIVVPPGPRARLSLARFASTNRSVRLRVVPGGSVTQLTIPRDGAAVPWRLRVDAAQAATVCG